MSNYEAIVGLYVLPLLIWIGVMLFMRSITAEVSQIQSAILFCLAFFLLASLVMLNVTFRTNPLLLTLAAVESIALAALVYIQLKKVIAKQPR